MSWSSPPHASAPKPSAASPSASRADRPNLTRNEEQRGSDMTAVHTVAIAGCGVAALATAIQLAKAGVDVRVFESKPQLSALGSGITLQGNALRVLGELGVWD